MSTMNNEKTPTLSHGFIWFGAAISIAEILTGTFLAPLGFVKGLLAILIGHAIGAALFYLAGLIGAKTGKSAMDTVKMSFGEKGSYLFSGLNVLQLIGWTAIMILSGSKAIGTISTAFFGQAYTPLWSLLIGGLILVWLIVGFKYISRLSYIAVGALFILTLILSRYVFGDVGSEQVTGTMGFGEAVELAVAMPLSWLPLVADYTRHAKKPIQATGVSTVVYFMASSWMYVIGLAAALFTGESDIAAIMLTAGIGWIGIVILILSTVTTTFMDAYSAGVSMTSIHSKFNEKTMGIIVGIVGTVLAITAPVDSFEGFLYLLGSVFAPMITIMIGDYLFHRGTHEQESVYIMNMILWLVGFLLYRWFLTIQTPIGSTLPVVLIILALYGIINGRNRGSKVDKI